MTIEQDGLSNNDEIEVVPEIGVEMEVEGEPEAAMQDLHEELDPDDHCGAPAPEVQIRQPRNNGRRHKNASKNDSVRV